MPLTQPSHSVVDRMPTTRRCSEQPPAAPREVNDSALLAHELRSPLSVLALVADALHQTGHTAESLGRLAGLIGRQVAHMSRLIEDVIDDARQPGVAPRLHAEALDLREVVALASEQARPAMALRCHTLEAVFDSQPVPVWGDRVRLVQVVSNLLVNAAKFTPDGGQVLVRGWRSTDRAVLLVADTGEGMSGELLDSAFDAFHQGSSGSAGSDGLGLGLGLVRQLVAQHGGTITARSAGPGQGSEFRVVLPARQRSG